MTKLPNDQRLSAILEDTEIPFAYQMSYILNFYREPSYRQIEITYGLQRTEVSMLIFLVSQSGVPAQDMCDFSGHLKANVSRAAIALQKKGLIVRKRDPDDNRKQLLYLTPAGREIYSEFMPLLIDREHRMIECLSESEKVRLRALLSKVAAHVPTWAGKP